MNILYLGNAQGFNNAPQYYLTPQRLINGFTRLDHNVYVFNDKDYARYTNVFKSQGLGRHKMNLKVIEVCKDFQPDMIVLGHCKAISNDTLSLIRETNPDVRIVYRNVDPLNSTKNITEIKQRMGHVDAMFITTAGVGLEQFSNDAGSVYFMPNPVDPALDNKQAFANSDADIDLLFLASFLRDQNDHRHITAQHLLQNKGDLNIHIGGAGINKDRIFGAEYYKILERSKMGLCISKTADYYLYSSDRMSQYMAAGLLAFIPHGPQFEDVLGDDAFISYKSDEELLDKVKYYSKNSEERIEIARKGHARIHDIFHVDKICQYIIERAFDLSLSQDYKWPTAKH